MRAEQGRRGNRQPENHAMNSARPFRVSNGRRLFVQIAVFISGEDRRKHNTLCASALPESAGITKGS